MRAGPPSAPYRRVTNRPSGAGRQTKGYIMNHPRLGLGRDFFELIRPSSVRSIFLKEKLDWTLYYLQLTKGFVMPEIEIFYDKPLPGSGYALIIGGERLLEGETKTDESGVFDFFETFLYDLLDFLTRNPQTLFNDDSYEFWLEHTDLYDKGEAIGGGVSMKSCLEFLKSGNSLSLRRHLAGIETKSPPDCSIRNPDDLKRFVKGLFLMADGKIAEASAVFNGIPEDSSFIISHFRGEIALFKGEMDNASELMSSCMETCPYYSDVLYLSAAYALSKGNPYRCCQILKEARILYPGNVMFSFLLAKMYSCMEKNSIANTIINKAASGDKLFPGLLLDYAIINSSDFKKAESTLRDALRMNPGHIPSSLTLSTLYLDNGMRDKALSIMEKAVEERPGDAECRRLLGRIFMEKGEPERAEEAIRTAASIDPTYIYDLALFYISCGRNDKALPILKTYLALNPYNKKAYKYMEEISNVKGRDVIMPDLDDD